MNKETAKKRLRWCGEFLLAPALVVVASTLLGLVSFLCWPLELFGHFCLQYIVLLAVAAPFLRFLKYSFLNRICLALVLLSLVANVVLVSLSYWPAPKTNGSAKELALLQFNVNSSNRNYSAFNELVQHLKPDLLCIEEIGPGWEQNLSSLKESYPYQIVRSRPDNFGIALLSKFPFEAQLIPFGAAAVPTVWAKVSIEPQAKASPLGLIVTHPLPPVSPGYTKMRDSQLKLMADKINETRGNLILAGDLNSTPWTYAFKDLLRDAALSDTRAAHPSLDMQCSWPAGLWPLRLPIDHVLYRGNLQCLERRIEADCGSDHLPVYVRFAHQ